MSDRYLVHPGRMHPGKRDETGRIQRLEGLIAALTERVAALENTAPPNFQFVPDKPRRGRPPKVAA